MIRGERSPFFSSSSLVIIIMEAAAGQSAAGSAATFLFPIVHTRMPSARLNNRTRRNLFFSFFLQLTEMIWKRREYLCDLKFAATVVVCTTFTLNFEIHFVVPSSTNSAG